MAGTAVTKLSETYVAGGLRQIWRCSIDPASVAAAAQGIETITIPGARAGDPVMASVEAIETQLLPQGAKVTADDTVSVYINNGINATTAINGGAKLWYIDILKLAGHDNLAA